MFDTEPFRNTFKQTVNFIQRGGTLQLETDKLVARNATLALDYSYQQMRRLF